MRLDNGSGGYRERFVRSFTDWLILSILRSKPAYGYEMISVIDEEFRVFVSPGSLYPILHSLEHSGLVKGEWDDPDRRSRKIYELTPEGVRTHRDGIDSIGRILDSFQRLAGKGGPPKMLGGLGRAPREGRISESEDAAPFARRELKKLPFEERASWGSAERVQIIRRWHEPGYPDPRGD